jgi:hypothetical protein
MSSAVRAPERCSSDLELARRIADEFEPSPEFLRRQAELELEYADPEKRFVPVPDGWERLPIVGAIMRRADEHHAWRPVDGDALSTADLKRMASYLADFAKKQPAQSARPVARSRSRRPRRHATRSSQRSGDGGDSDGEPSGRCCRGCGDPIKQRESRARTCAKCRKRRSRAKQADPRVEALLEERAGNWAEKLSADYIQREIDERWDAIRRRRVAETPGEEDDQDKALVVLMEWNYGLVPWAAEEPERPPRPCRRPPREWSVRPRVAVA